MHVLWHGLTRTPFTYELAEELLLQAGFSEVRRVEHGQTLSAHVEIVALDSRSEESFHVEAVR